MISERPKEAFVYRFFPGTGKSYDHIVNLCTLGFDRRWKKEMLEMIPAGAKRILDQACGTGNFTFMLARWFPRSRIIGLDLLEEYLALARKKSADLKIDNVQFFQGRAEEIRLKPGFDCITSCYLAKYAEMEELVANIKGLLLEGGRLIMQDFTYPSNPLNALLFEFYFKILRTIGSRLYPEWKAVFEDLPGMLRESRWVEELVQVLRKNGFSDIRRRFLTLGTAAIISAIRK
jgi:demethylmenaquinone methyltransferase/2-methoxy-6-polyprenyl-1,4-benzoquinol methylase